MDSSLKDDLLARLENLEDKLNTMEYALTYCKLKNTESPILITASGDQTIKLWNLDTVILL